MNNLLTRIAFLTTKQVAFIALAIGGFYWYSFFDDGSSLDPQIAALTSQLQVQQGKKSQTESALKKRDHLQETLATLTANYESLRRLVPIEMNSFELNKQIDQLRKTSRINQTSRKPLDIVKVKDGLLDEWPVELKFIGAYSDIAQFVYQASTTEKVMLVKKLKIVSADPYDGRLSFDITVSAYKLSNPSDTAPAARKSP